MRQELKNVSCENNLKEQDVQFEDKKTGPESRYVKRCHRGNDQGLGGEIINLLEGAYFLFRFKFCTAVKHSTY